MTSVSPNTDQNKIIKHYHIFNWLRIIFLSCFILSWTIIHYYFVFSVCGIIRISLIYTCGIIRISLIYTCGIIRISLIYTCGIIRIS